MKEDSFNFCPRCRGIGIQGAVIISLDEWPKRKHPLHTRIWFGTTGLGKCAFDFEGLPIREHRREIGPFLENC